MVIAEDRWGIAAAGAQLVFGDLVGPGNLATSGLDLVRSAPLRERMNVQTRIGAVELRTGRSVLVHINVAKRGLDLVVLVGISAKVKMLGNDAGLGISA